MLRAGIIGCGGITERRHGPVLASMEGQVEIVGLADPAEERLHLMGERLGIDGDHRYRDCGAMLNGENLDLVHICTPHHLHESQAVAALEAGAHVFLEKPMATSLEEADRMIAAARATDRLLTVGHNQRFSAAHRAAMAQIDAGAIGTVFLVRAEGIGRSHVSGRGVEPDWRTQTRAGGGGPLINVGYHYAYRAVDYAGSRAMRVFARVDRHVQDIEVEDTALLLIEHESGATTSLQVGWSAPAGAIAVNEVLGTEGQIRFGGADAPVSVWRREAGDWAQPPVDPEGPDEVGFPLVVQRFVDAILSGGEVPVTGADARHILAIVLAAYESGRTGEPVEVD